MISRRFAGSRAVAVDSSIVMVDRLRDRAEHLGLSDRVTTMHLDLDQVELELVDLAWAAGSLHHLSDPDRALRNVAGRIRPGGLERNSRRSIR